MKKRYLFLLLLGIAASTTVITINRAFEEKEHLIQKWKKAASSIMEDSKTPTPEDLRKYLQMQEKAKNIAGYHKQWYLKKKIRTQ